MDENPLVFVLRTLFPLDRRVPFYVAEMRWFVNMVTLGMVLVVLAFVLSLSWWRWIAAAAAVKLSVEIGVSVGTICWGM